MKTKKYQNIKIFIETSTGQGNEMCYKLADLAHFYKKLSANNSSSIRNRFGICLDTCHIFASGIDIRTPATIIKFFKKFDKMIGIKHIKLCHFNDSKNDLGSMIDRHEDIGKGFIGMTALLFIKKLLYKKNIPMILETPNYYI